MTVPEEYFIDPDPPAPTPRRKPTVVSEPEERPRRKPVVAEDDDDDFRPRKKKKGMPEKSPPYLLFGVLAGVAGATVLGGIVYAITRSSSATETAVVTSEKSGTPTTQPATIPPPPPPVRPPGGSTPKPEASTRPFLTINSIAPTPDGTQVIVHGNVSLEPHGGLGAAEAHVRVWDIDKGWQAREFLHPKITVGFTPIALSRDGKTLAVYGDQSLIFFAAETRAVMSVGKLPTDGGRVRIIPKEITFHADGKTAHILAEEHLLTFQVGDGSCSVKKPKIPYPSTAQYLPDLDRVVDVRRASDDFPTEISTWKPGSDDPPTIVRLQEATGNPASFAFTRDGKTVAICTDEKIAKVRIHDTATGKLIRQLPADEHPDFRKYTSLVFSSDAKLLAGTGTEDVIQNKFHSVDIFRASDGKRVYRKLGTPGFQEGGFATGLAFKADGSSLFFILNSKSPYVINLRAEDD